MPHVDQFVTVTQAKAQLLELIRRLNKQHDSVGITRDGIPTAVLLSMDYFEGLMETLDILSDQTTLRHLRRSLKQAQSDQWETEKSVFGSKGV